MKEVISALEQLRDTLEESRESLRAQPWPSRAISRLANDVIIWAGMTAKAADALAGLLKSLEEPKEEVIETIEEEEGGEGSGEPDRKPEDSEAGATVPAQEPEGKGPKGSKRVRRPKR